MGLPDVPGEIVYDILSRLPVKSLCRFKLVSKSWLALMTDPEFIKSHLHHQSTNDNNINHKIILCSGPSPSMYSVDYQAPDHNVTELKSPPGEYYVKIVGSFNGIVLLRMVGELCLWNPSAKMYQKFSPPEGENGSVKYGLCHDSVSDDFKVVSVNSRLSDGRSAVHMFTSKLSSWKRIGDFGNFIIGAFPGAVLNGAPHWFAGGDTDGVHTNFIKAIVCFDVTEEKFKEVTMPKIFEGGNTYFDLGVLGGCLCGVDNNSWKSHSDVWVMKEYGVKESWIKLFVVPNVLGEFCFRYIRVLGYRKDGEVVMVLNSTGLVIYNPKQNIYKRIEIPQDCKWFDAAFYTESLVSPRVCNGSS